MEITFKELVELYDTNIDLNKVSSKLKNKVLFDTEYIPLNNIKKPKHEKHDGIELYTYKLNDEENTNYIIEYEPSNYRTMSLTIERMIDGQIPDSITYGYNGEITVFS